MSFSCKRRCTFPQLPCPMSDVSMPRFCNSARPFASFCDKIAVPSVCGIPQHTATHANPRNAGDFVSGTSSAAARASARAGLATVSATAACAAKLDADVSTTRARRRARDPRPRWARVGRLHRRARRRRRARGQHVECDAKCGELIITRGERYLRFFFGESSNPRWSMTRARPGRS